MYIQVILNTNFLFYKLVKNSRIKNLAILFFIKNGIIKSWLLIKII